VAAALCPARSFCRTGRQADKKEKIFSQAKDLCRRKLCEHIPCYDNPAAAYFLSTNSLCTFRRFFTQINNTPAYETNITGAITEINGIKISSGQDIGKELANYKPGDTIQIKTIAIKESSPVFYSGHILNPAGIIVDPSNIRTYDVTLAEHPEDSSKAYLGINIAGIPTYQFLPGTAVLPLYILVFWLFFFSLAIGIVNLLPAKPLDGGLMYEEIVGKFTSNPKPIVRGTAYFMLFLIIINIVGPYLVNL
jgi:membrane-associated protease RseP (regulator of RpoE activity)